MLLEDRALAEQAARIETLLDEIESIPDQDARARVAGIVESLLTLYGQGLARMVETIRSHHPAGAEILRAFARDDLVSHLLLLHDLHPVELEVRVGQALEEVRPYLQSHGGNVELLGVERGVARLRLQGSCSGCPSSTHTLKLAIEEAIWKAAPDLEGIETEGVVEQQPASRPASTFIPLASL